MGNMTNDGTNSYSYDVEGRPVSAGGVTAIYDAFGRAVEINNGGTYTQIVYGPSGQKFAYLHVQSLQNYFVSLAGGVQAVYSGSGIQGYRHADWLGSVRFTATSGGGVTGDQAYAPFGESYASWGTGIYSFTGQTKDITSSTYDFLFRQYSPSEGRWLVPDPAGLAAVDLTNPQTWNRYAYVGNNPLSNVDPLGLQCVTLDNGVVGDDGNPPPCNSMTQGNGDADVNVNGGSSNDNSDRPEPGGIHTGTVIGPTTGGGRSWNLSLFKFGHCVPTGNGGWVCTATAKKLLNNLVSSALSLLGIDPTSDTPSCFVQFLKNTVNNANPLTPSPSSAGEAAGAVYAATKYNQALNYAATTPSATFGTSYLVYPFKSSVFRGTLEASQSGAMVGWLASIDVSMLQALVTEYQAAKAGECQ